jgi:predicted outer membrane repeat protein
VAAVAAAVAVAAGAGSAGATTITVNTTNTGLPIMCGTVLCCSIRQAIRAVNTKVIVNGCAAGNGNNDTINLPSGTLTATSTLTISQPVIIHGNGIGVTILRGNMTSNNVFFDLQAFPVGFGFSTQFQNVTIDRTGGAASVTGIRATQNWLQISGSRIAGFTASGIMATDTDLKLADTTIENNSSTSSGGGIQFNNPNFAEPHGIFAKRVTVANNTAPQGGGLFFSATGTTNIYTTTFANNLATNAGGAIFQTSDANYLFFFGSTIANNTATGAGGGIFASFGVKLFESIVGQNRAGATSPDIDGFVNNCKNTLIGTTQGIVQLADDGGNLFDVAPNLDTVLRDLGGTFHTKVLRPFPFSPVIDAFDSSDLDIAFDDTRPLDARGVVRPQFGGASASSGDMGAFESSRLEAESTNLGGGGPTAPYVVITNTQMSNGQGGNLKATAANQFVTYSTVSSLPAGTYKVTIGFQKASNAGRFQFQISANLAGTFSNVGAVQDGFATSSSVVTVNLPNVTLSGANVPTLFRFLVTGKNASSSSFQVFPDFIDFTKQ